VVQLFIISFIKDLIYIIIRVFFAISIMIKSSAIVYPTISEPFSSSVFPISPISRNFVHFFSSLCLMLVIFQFPILFEFLLAISFLRFNRFIFIHFLSSSTIFNHFLVLSFATFSCNILFPNHPIFLAIFFSIYHFGGFPLNIVMQITRKYLTKQRKQMFIPYILVC